MHYFVDIVRLQVLAAVLELRAGARIPPAQRRVLDRMLAGERSAALLTQFAARGVRELTGSPETLGAEWRLFGALLWRRALDLSVR